MGTQHMNYCMECGTKLTIKPLKGEGQVPYCEHCRSFVFPVFSTACSMIVMNPEQTKILLIKQYGRDDYILVAGYVNKGEDAEAAVELITDGFHIHPAVIRLVHRLFGEKLVLISDSLRCAGMPDGDYELGGLPITLTEGVARLRGSSTLAGSSIHLMDGLRRAVSFGVPLEAAVYAATAAPAKAIRRDHEMGALIPGRTADLVVLDQNLSLKAVYIDGALLR